jgi:crotonobetainyl-CoA:carnitine CoA-transferase CaiB-like acyl-CoA transferase
MAGALEGTRVIDFGQYVAGPMAAMLLADQGAGVIRVEPPGGPRFDTPANATWNRGKRAIVLDLKTPDDLAAARRLIASADVVIENFRPGVMDRLGLGPVAMTTANPRLVYCSLPGFAGDDRRARVAGWEGVVAAATATYRANPRTGRPVYTALPFSSSYAAFLAATSIAVALNSRQRDGVGQVVEVPLFDATFAAIGYRIGGDAITRGDPNVARMLGITRQFACKDGRWFMYHSGNKRATDFLRAAGIEDLLPGAVEKLTPQEIHARSEALFLTRTAAEWEAFCEEVGTEGSICRTSAEWMENEHALASGIVVEGDDPALGRFRGPGINVRMSGTPGSVRWARREPGADREDVLRSIPSPAARPDAHAEPLRAALEGVKVLDLCIVLAGPTCGRTLAEFGADVIRIDSPHRAAVAFHNDINRGKRSILLDLKTPEGLDIFWKLVEQADVVVQNFRKGVAERLGIHYAAVKARKPDIVYASLNTYGQVGPWSTRPGHEQIAQAATGMQERFGGDGRPTLAPFAVNDYGTGFMGAYGVALALLHRQRTGEGQQVDTALAYTATMLQSLYLHDYDGKTWDEPRGQDATGTGPLNRAYEASDGWFFLACRAAELRRLPGFRDLPPLGLEGALEIAFKAAPVAEWVARLTEAGAGAHAIVEAMAVLRDDPWVREHGLAITRDHPGQGELTTNGPSPRLSRTPPMPGRPAPLPGSDAASILSEIGMAAEMDRLVRDGVVVVQGVGVR